MVQLPIVSFPGALDLFKVSSDVLGLGVFCGFKEVVMSPHRVQNLQVMLRNLPNNYTRQMLFLGCSVKRSVQKGCDIWGERFGARGGSIFLVGELKSP